MSRLPFRPAWKAGPTAARVAVSIAMSAACLAGARAEETRHEPECLSNGATIEAVSRHEAVAPNRAITVARTAAPDAEVLRAALCRDGDGLTYRVMALRNDGRLVRVTVEAGTGKITAVH